MGEQRRPAHRSTSWWVLAVAAAITAMLAFAGATTGEWRAVLVTEVQVVVVASAAYLGLR
jgi:cation transport ATPase